MRIDKITFKNNQAWITIYSSGIVDSEYFGTWHIVNPILVEWLRNANPKDLRFMDYEGCENG